MEKCYRCVQKGLGDIMYENKGYTVYEKRVLSSNGKNELVGKVYRPLGEIRGYVHIVHGMTEHIERYHSLMTRIVENGYIVFGYDHLGHGKTAKDDSELGFFAENNGDDLLAHDVKVFADAMKAECGEYPYYLLGHSMGSFVVRMATQKYITPDKLIIMGTGGPMPILVFGIYLAKFVKMLKGPRHISKLIDSIAFGSYNERFKDENDPHAWLTTDKEVRNKYAADKYCTFPFTVAAMHDLISLTYNANKEKWFKSVAKKMPILLLSGADDVVGEYGKGVQTVEKKLLENGANVKLKLYPGNRHEPHNDMARDEVLSDILEFIA